MVDEQSLATEINEKLMKSIANEDNPNSGENIHSQEYLDFKKQYIEKHLSLYEKACQISEKMLRMGVSKKERPELLEAIDTCHIETTPEGTASFAAVIAGSAFLVILMFSVIVLAGIVGDVDAVGFFGVIGLIVAVLIYIPAKKLPYTLASLWRMKASNQMIICVFYTVTYMRHTSNLENAIKFASDHIEYPLSLDLKKILWNVETEKFESVRQALENYLEIWKEYAPEFVESMHMIESSLLEGEESRRLDALDKALNEILEETYEKMLHYAHNLSTPLVTLNMLGVVMPVLGLVILPLMVSMMDVPWYNLAAIYNILIFMAVYSKGMNILTMRPSGYGDADISNNPALNKHKGIDVNLGIGKVHLSPLQVGISITTVFLILAFSPIFLNFFDPYFDETITQIIYSYSLLTKKLYLNYLLALKNRLFMFSLIGALSRREILFWVFFKRCTSITISTSRANRSLFNTCLFISLYIL